MTEKTSGNLDDWLPVVINRLEGDHDETLGTPPWLDAEHWLEFGRADQRRLLELEGRFGSWSDGAAATLVDELKQGADPTACEDVEAAFSAHFSDTGADALDGALHFRYLRDELLQQRAPDGRGEARVAAAERLHMDVAAAVQWDMYHRASAPDIIVFHGGDTPVAKRLENIREEFPHYAGYSWTPIVDPSASFGRRPYAIRLPIRLLVVSWWVPFGESARKVLDQHEVAPRDRLVLDPASSTAFEFDDGMQGLVEYFSKERAPRPGREWDQLLRMVH